MEEQEAVYEPPTLVEIGAITELVLGSDFQDTADKKNKYY
ncbi:lasso RiPP family leader peptide-containing protein [Actinoalloteichus spitiensis]|nr:lasso RiPP family leader peptide-containing protein [Actinoalloteichus spitiensis]